MLNVTRSPASISVRKGCASMLEQTLNSTLLVGQTSSVIASPTNRRTVSLSSRHRTPWPIRSAPRASKAPMIDAGPSVSPAWGTECRPSAMAFEKSAAYGSGGKPTSYPPNPMETSPLGAWFEARKSDVTVEPGISRSRGMSITQFSNTPCSVSARVRPTESAWP